MQDANQAADPAGAAVSVGAPLTEEMTGAFLSSAFAGRPGWVVRRRERVPSFQQFLERIEVAWPGEDGVPAETVFLRVYRGLLSWWSLATPDLPRRERAARRVAARAGVPVPETLWAGEASGLAVAVQRLAPGRPLDGGTVTDALEAALGRALAGVHGARVEAEDRRHLPDVSLDVLFPRLLSWAREAGAEELAESARRLRQQFREEIVERPAAFLHGDFHDGNVLVDAERGAVTAVIDWEEAAYGDPRLDLAVMEGVLRRRYGGAGRAFLAAYEAASGFAPGPLKPWSDLCGLRSRIVGAWVRERVARGEPLPSLRPEAWYG